MTTATTRTPAVRKTSSIMISKGLSDALDKAAKKIKVSKSALVKEALLSYMEDVDDIQVLHDRKNEPTATLAEVRKRLGL